MSPASVFSAVPLNGWYEQAVEFAEKPAMIFPR
jgi:hypothetical protein